MRVGKESVEACNPSIQAGRSVVWGQPGLLSKHFKNEVKVLHMLSHLGWGSKGLGVQRLIQLYIKLEASLGYMMPSVQKRGVGWG